jgi:hypothetical protein
MELAGRCGFLQAELAGARDRILALEAPKDATAVAEPDPPAPPPRPWWRFW